MSIDDEALARLRELLAKATPGPWRCNDGPEGYQHRLWVDLTETAFATVCDVRNTADAELLAAMHEALPALLDIAEAVARAPVGRIDIGRHDCDAEDAIEFLPDDGPESTAWAMGCRHVRIVPCTGGAE